VVLIHEGNEASCLLVLFGGRASFGVDLESQAVNGSQGHVHAIHDRRPEHDEEAKCNIEPQSGWIMFFQFATMRAKLELAVVQSTVEGRNDFYSGNRELEQRKE